MDYFHQYPEREKTVAMLAEEQIVAFVLYDDTDEDFAIGLYDIILAIKKILLILSLASD